MNTEYYHRMYAWRPCPSPLLHYYYHTQRHRNQELSQNIGKSEDKKHKASGMEWRSTFTIDSSASGQWAINFQLVKKKGKQNEIMFFIFGELYDFVLKANIEEQSFSYFCIFIRFTCIAEHQHWSKSFAIEPMAFGESFPFIFLRKIPCDPTKWWTIVSYVCLFNNILVKAVFSYRIWKMEA